jgi:hypothetical protein
MKSILLAVVVLIAPVLLAAPGEGVLVPIFYGDPGAHGSIWRTRLTVLNDSDQPLEGIQLFFSCPIPEGCPLAFPARSSWTTVARNGSRYDLGFFLFPETVADVSYALRVYDESRSAENYGTDIPVVPVSDFSAQKLQMLDVPRDPASRLTLRIYAIPPGEPRVRVRVYEDPALSESIDDPVLPPRLLSETFHDLRQSPFSEGSASFSRPSGVVVSDVLATVPEGTSEAVRVEVQTADGSTPIWAFISVANNTTQLVTTIVPRPPT